MTDATRRDNGSICRDNDATPAGEWLSASEAAERLGVTVRTVQRRALKGEWPSRTDEGRRLFVCLPNQNGGEPVATPAENVATNGSFDATRRDTEAESATEPDASGTTALIEQLRTENEFLRAEVERHHQAESEMRRLMLEDKRELTELRQRLAITARLTTDAPQETPTTNDGQEPEEAEKNAGKSTEKRHWWQLWKR